MSDHDRRNQLLQSLLKAGFMLFLLAANLGLTACGKKPGHVDPPPDVTETHYPQVYPDPSTDPKPEDKQ